MNPTHRRHTASRHIRAAPETVYRAFLDPEAVRLWLPPKGATMRIDTFEPRAGGAFRMTLTFDSAPGKSSENTDVVQGRFVRLVPGKSVVQSIAFASDDPAFAGTMTMTWTLAAAEGGTDVTVIADDVPPGISRADHETGMNSTLAKLAAHVEQARGAGGGA